MGILDAPVQGNVNPSDVGYDLILLMGQSNMSGRGTAYDVRLDPAEGKVWQYGNSGTYAGTISQAFEPLSMHDTPTGMGPGLVFARWYANTVPANRRILLVPVAHGGTALSTNNVLGWRKGVAGNLYANTIAQTQSALTAAGANSRVVAALWLQGETDGDIATTGTQYQTDFDSLVSGLRTDLGISTLPFVVGQMVPEYLPSGTRAAINTVHINTPSRKTRTAVALAPANMNNNDGNHFNAAAQRIMGRNMFDAYQRIIKGQPDPAIPSIPGQTTGLNAPSVAAGGMTLSWTTTPGASVYYVERQLTTGGTWARFATPTTNSASFAGMAPSTSYDFRVTPVNAAGPGTTSAVFTQVTNSNATTLLGVTAVVERAYSLRQLSGSNLVAVRVRRSSDNAEQDIGFVSGALDTATLLSFVGAGDGCVTTFYDQSPSAKHITQTTASAQPKIVSAGSLVTSGGKPAVTFDGVTNVLWDNLPALYAAGAMTVTAVLSATSTTGSKRWYGESLSTASANQYSLLSPDKGTSSAASPVLSGVIGGQSATVIAFGSAAAFNGAIFQASATDTGTSMAQWVNAAVDLAATTYARSGISAMDRFALGGVVRNGSLAPLPMLFSEAVFWPAALGTTDRQSAESNQKAFYGTP